jgi:predicted dehydrogenase
MLKAATIGISGFGNTIYGDLTRESEKGNLEFAAAAVINQDEEKEKCDKMRSMGCRIFSDYKQMLAEMGSELDLCFIPTGIHLHAPMTIDALRAGVNVVVEKPIAATVQEVAEMKKVSQETGKFVAVGYQTMYVPETEMMKKKIVEGALGKIKTVKCRACWPRNEKYYTRNNWAGKLRSGNSWVLDSPYNNALAHQLNMICFLGGTEFSKSANLKEVQAELYRANPTIESVDTACIKCVSDVGTKLFFIVTHAVDENFGPEISVVGEKGRIDWSNHGTVFNIDGQIEKVESSVGQTLRDCLQEKIQKRVSDDNVFICDPDIAGTQTLCVNGAHDSAEIVPVASEHVKKVMVNDSPAYAIDNIYGIIEEAFNQEKMFSELSIPWAKPSKVFSLENYDFFPKKADI